MVLQMSYSNVLVSALAVLPLARGIAFGGPAPTATAADREQANVGISPMPTKGPSVAELRKRQFAGSTCGWIDGDYSSGLTCHTGSCMLYTASDAVGMAGCCIGSDTQDCGWANSCIDYDAYTAGSCDTDCELNTFIRKCSNSLYPVCHTWTYPGDNVRDFGCTDLDYGIETVLQSATDTFYSLSDSISLPTVDGAAVTGWDGSSATDGDSFTTTDSDGSTFETSFPSSGGGSSSSRKTKKKVGVAVIAGAVIGALVLLFVVGAVIIFLCVKKRKSKQLAANQQAVAAAQASRPQSQYPPQQPQMMQQPPAPPMPPQTPQLNGYFAPQGQDQKINPQTQVHEYGHQSPVSNPPTPAPAYVQPYYAAPNAPPMPPQSPAPYPNREPTPGTHEVDSINVARPPPPQGPHGTVYEMGHGK